MNIIQKACNIGISQNSSNKHINTIRVLNIFSFILAILTFINANLFLFIFQVKVFSIVLIFVSFSYLLFPLFNYLQLFIFSKIAFIFYINFLIVLLCCKFTADSSYQYMFVSATATPLFLVKQEDLGLRWLGFLLPLVGFFTVEWAHYSLFEPIVLSEQAYTLIHQANVVIIFVLNGSILFVFAYYAKQSENKVLGLLKKTKEQNRQLRVREEELQFHKVNLEKNIVERTKALRKSETNLRVLLKDASKKNILLKEKTEQLNHNIEKLEAIQEKMAFVQREQTKFVQIIENSSDFIALFDLNGNLLYINHAGKTMVGIAPRVDLRTLKIENFSTKKSIVYVIRKIIPYIKKNGYWNGELKLLHQSDQSLIDTDATVFLITDEITQKPLSIATIQRNITQRKLADKAFEEAQMQLIQSEKMASLGILTAGIAHEINNPINFVYASINTLRTFIDDIYKILEEYQSVEHNLFTSDYFNKIKQLKQQLGFNELVIDIDELVDNIKEGASRTIDIIKGLRNFSRTDTEIMNEADVNEIIDSTLIILKSKIKNKIDIEKNFDALPKIKCHLGQLHQVFMNIINNAIEAIPEKGKIWISTHNLKNEIKIIIKDNGVGIPKKIQKRIFEPFFTTKDVGKGTGLGMSISYGIIEKHNGSIRLESKVNSGTTFTILIPHGI